MIFLVFYLFLLSCNLTSREPHESSLKVFIDYKNEPIKKQEYKKEFSLYEDLKQIPLNYLPKKILSSNYNILSKNKIEFILQNDEKVIIEKIYYFDHLTYCVQIFKTSYSKVKTLIYFLQYKDENWNNELKNLISEEFFEFFKNKFKFVNYNKIEALELYDSIGYFFDFENKYVFEVNEKFDFNYITNFQIYANKVYIYPKEFNENEELVNSEKFTEKKYFNDFTEAIKNPKEVNILDLSDAGLDFIPPKIFEFQNLEVLILDNNNLQYLPEEVCNFKKLKILSVNNNKIKELPKNINKLSNLRDLSLQNNELKILPLNLFKINSLQKISLSNNKISFFDYDLSKLEFLTYLDLSNNKINKLPYSLSKLKKLETLDVSGNPIKWLPINIYELKNLKNLNLSNTLIEQKDVFLLKDKLPNAYIISNY